MGMLKVNGAERRFEGPLPASVADLLTVLGVDAATVVAELDGKIIERKDFGSIGLSEGQSFELIRFVGGG